MNEVTVGVDRNSEDMEDSLINAPNATRYLYRIGSSASQEKVSNSEPGVENMEWAIVPFSISATYPLAIDDAVVPGEEALETGTDEGIYGDLHYIILYKLNLLY
ncbi:unnamed protein product [Gordionus sp. m RMFG-2023]